MMTRRDLLRSVAGTVGLLRWPLGHASGEPPPETLGLRTTASKIGLCVMGPKIAAEALWRAEGFTDVQYIPVPGDKLELRLASLASGATDIETTFVSSLIPRIDAGDPIVILAGLHAGCFELFGGERVRVIRDLKGKTAFIASMVYTSAWTPAAMAAGSPRHRRSRSSGSRTARWMRSSGFPPFLKSCGPGASAVSWSTARWIGRGLSTAAA